MVSSGKEKTFSELMDQLDDLHHAYWSRRMNEKTFAKKQLALLQQAAKIAKSDKERLIANAKWLQFKEDYGL